MRQLSILCLTTSLLLVGCADHAGTSLARTAPPTPINQPDSGAGTSGGSSTNGLENKGGQLPPPEGTIAGTAGGGSSGSSGSGGTGATGNGGNGPTPNVPPEGGAPVPEPSTLLLVGTGLAGAALLRRRRRPEVEKA